MILSSFMKKPIYVLGINSVYHESSAAILGDGKLIAAVEEERFNRVKHAKPARVDNPDVLPEASIQYCLERAGVGFEDINHVAYSFNPHRRKKSYWSDGYNQAKSWGTPHGEEIFYRKILAVPRKIKTLSKGAFAGKFHWIDHHVAHAAGTFFVSPFDEALVVVVDGIGENASAWMGYGERNKLTKIREIFLPHSLGFMWEKFSEYLGFSEYDAGKVMGLSSYGDWKTYWKQFHKIVSFDNRDIFHVDNDIMRFRIPDFTKLEELFGVKRRFKEEKILPEHEHIAAGLQKISQKVVLRIVKNGLEKHPSKNICLSGGVVLNCVANEETFLKLPIDDIFIPPSTHDGGNAIGAAFYVWNQILKKPRGFVLKNPYTGPEFSDKEMKEALEKGGLKFEKVRNIERYAAKLIADGKIVAWYQGRMELVLGRSATEASSLIRATPMHARFSI